MTCKDCVKNDMKKIKVRIKSVEQPFEWEVLAKKVDDEIQFAEMFDNDKNLSDAARLAYHNRKIALQWCKQAIYDTLKYSQFLHRGDKK